MRDGRVVLVSAPAGSGKTVLVSSWARRRTGPNTVAWVDCAWLVDTPAAFWEATVVALAGIHDIEKAPMPIRDGVTADRRYRLDSLIDWLSVLPDGQVIVWDDFHHVASRETQTDLQYLLDRLPPNVSLILATRSLPQLALHQARLEGRLTEIRAAELAFTLEETAGLLSRNGIGLSAEQVTRLERATHGWAAGLRLAMISMAHSDDPSAVIERLASTSEAVSGYLTEQVMAQLNPDDREFLHGTCVMDTLTGPLVQALTGRRHGLAELRKFAERVGFLTRTSDIEDVYRYHPMFVGILRSELRLHDPDRLAESHVRAAMWLHEDGQTMAALDHAVRGQAWAFVGRVVALEIIDLAGAGLLSKVSELLEELPAAVKARDPRVQLAEAVVAILSDDGSRANRALDRVAGVFSLDDPDGRRFLVISDIARGLLARYRGDAPGILAALPSGEPDLPALESADSYRVDAGLRVSWLGHRAAALLWDDQLPAAVNAAESAAPAARSAASGWHELGAVGVLAVAAAVSGDLTGADTRAAEMARTMTLRRWSTSPFLALGDIAEAWCAIERLDPDTAAQGLARGEQRWVRLASGFPGYFLPLLSARRALAIGDFAAVPDLLTLATARGQFVRSRLLSRIHAGVSVQFALAVGDLDTAQARARDSTAGVRVLVAAHGGADLSSGHGPSLVPEAEDALAGDLGLTVRTLLTVARSRQRAGDGGQADALLGRALDLAAKHGFRLPFLEQAEATRALLLVAQVAALRNEALVAELLALTTPREHGPRPYYVMPLTARELEVLRHLAAHAAVTEIADHMFVSRNTVRTHVKSIYRKLSTNSRREAVLRAVEVGIL